MGTSASNSGPNDKTPLLPAWALANPPIQPAPTQPPDASPSVGEEGDSPPVSGSGSTDEPEPVNPQTPQVAAPIPKPVRGGPWTLARRAMSSAVKSGGNTGRLRTASRRYVSAKGGAKKAAQSSSAGRATTGGLGGFLADVATKGFGEAARSIGLHVVVGQRRSRQRRHRLRGDGVHRRLHELRRRRRKLWLT